MKLVRAKSASVSRIKPEALVLVLAVPSLFAPFVLWTAPKIAFFEKLVSIALVYVVLAPFASIASGLTIWWATPWRIPRRQARKLLLIAIVSLGCGMWSCARVVGSMP